MCRDFEYLTDAEIEANLDRLESTRCDLIGQIAGGRLGSESIQVARESLNRIESRIYQLVQEQSHRALFVPAGWDVVGV